MSWELSGSGTSEESIHETIRVIVMTKSLDERAHEHENECYRIAPYN